MIPYTRHKSLKKQFWGIRINEQDLARLGRIISKLSDKYKKPIEIEIGTADNEDVVRTEDWNFFLSSDMPPVIQTVEIAYSHYSIPISCRLKLGSEKVELSTDGTDSDGVQGIFHDIEREIETKYHLWTWFTRALHKNYGLSISNFVISFLLGFLMAYAVYSLFDFFLDLIVRTTPEFTGSSTHNTIMNIGWAFVFFAYFVGLLSTNFLKKRYPAVEFTNRISDKYSKFRSMVLMFILLIILPIIVNLASSFITR
jgi:hypothetical protein